MIDSNTDGFVEYNVYDNGKTRYNAYAKNIMASVIDILREKGYENFTDFDLLPVFNDLGQRVYNESYASGNDCQWHRDDICSRLNMPDGKVLLITVYSDKTARDLRGKVCWILQCFVYFVILTRTHYQTMMWPLYVSVGNLSEDCRNERRSHRHIGFFPVTKHKSDSNFNRRLYQRVLMWVLQPLIARQDTGFQFKTADDRVFTLFPVLNLSDNTSWGTYDNYVCVFHSA